MLGKNFCPEPNRRMHDITSPLNRPPLSLQTPWGSIRGEPGKWLTLAQQSKKNRLPLKIPGRGRGVKYRLVDRGRLDKPLTETRIIDTLYTVSPILVFLSMSANMNWMPAIHGDWLLPRPNSMILNVVICFPFTLDYYNPFLLHLVDVLVGILPACSSCPEPDIRRFRCTLSAAQPGPWPWPPSAGQHAGVGEDLYFHSIQGMIKWWLESFLSLGIWTRMIMQYFTKRQSTCYQ